MCNQGMPGYGIHLSTEMPVRDRGHMAPWTVHFLDTRAGQARQGTSKSFAIGKTDQQECYTSPCQPPEPTLFLFLLAVITPLC